MADTTTNTTPVLDHPADEEATMEPSYFDRGVSSASGVLNKVFSSCEDDPKGSVHRAWGISLIFVLVFFILSVIEMLNLQQQGGSKALVVASVWTGLIHLLLGVLGTFVLKRFPTSFSVGFFLGVLIILANQNLILFGTFHNYQYGTKSTNKAFASVGFSLFAVLTFFAVLVFHFKKYIVVAPIDAKGLRGSATSEVDSAGDSYVQHDEAVPA